MTTQIIYIAEDGKTFNNEEECYKYELSLKSAQFCNEAFLYDEEGRPLPLTDEGFSDAFFIKCKTDEAAQFMKDAFTGNWVSPWDSRPAMAGCWIFRDYIWWQPIDEFLAMYDIAKNIRDI